MAVSTYVNVQLSRDNSLEKEGWYWPAITRLEAAEILNHHQHGDFLVRDATGGNEYTIDVKKGNDVRSLRIMSCNSMYGLVHNRCVFPSVAALIRQMLLDPGTYKENFPSLDFFHAVCKEKVTEDKLMVQHFLLKLVNKSKELVAEHLEYTTHVERMKTVTMEMQTSQAVLRSLNVVLQMFEEQLKTLREAGTDGETEEKISQRVHGSMAAVCSRILTIKTRQDNEQGKLFNLQCEHQYLLETVEHHKPRLTQLDTEQYQLRRKAEEHGISKTYLDLLVRREQDEDLRPFCEQLWLVDCDRLAAEAVLAGHIPGTFLVRPKRPDYVLSVVCAHEEETRVHHFCILHPNGLGYGFVDDFCIFPTLHDLVVKHRIISLRHYRFNSDVCLTCPVGYKHSAG